jgi:hypothetical protein
VHTACQAAVQNDAARDRHSLGTRLRPQLGDHGRRRLDPVHANAAATDGQCNASGADPQLQGGTGSRQIGQEIHDRVD